jgi:hypothetical protein
MTHPSIRWYHRVRVSLFKVIYGTPRLCPKHSANLKPGRSSLLDSKHCVICKRNGLYYKETQAEVDEINEMCRKLRDDNEWRNMNGSPGKSR